MASSAPRRNATPHRRGRAQCIVHRREQILLVRHVHAEDAYWVLPGGGIEEGETPAAAAIREMAEECTVRAAIVRELSRVHATDGQTHYTFLADIGKQQPALGAEDGDEERVLRELAWKSIDELAERERLHLWSAGLLFVREFYEQFWPRPLLP